MKKSIILGIAVIVAIGVILFVINFKQNKKIILKTNHTTVLLELPQGYVRDPKSSASNFYAIIVNTTKKTGLHIIASDLNTEYKNYEEYRSSKRFFNRCVADGPSGSQFCDKVIEEKTSKYDNGLIAHFYVLQVIDEKYIWNGSGTEETLGRSESSSIFYDVEIPDRGILEISETYGMDLNRQDIEEVIKSIKIVK